MASFEKSYAYLHELEGIARNLGYVSPKVKTDLGGETLGGRTFYWKVTRAKLPIDIKIWKIVEVEKTKDSFPEVLEMHPTLGKLIMEAYKQDEWTKILGDLIPVQEVADEVFEFAVHKTPRVSVRFLQQCINYLNYDGKLFPDLSERGYMGPITAGAISILASRKGDIGTLLKMFNCEQGHYYMKRFRDSPDQEANARGFFRRVEIRRRLKA